MYIFSIRKYILMSVLIHLVIALFIGVCHLVDNSNSEYDVMFFNHNRNKLFYQIEVVDRLLTHSKPNEKNTVQNAEAVKFRSSAESQVDANSNNSVNVHEEMFQTDNFSRQPAVISQIKFKRTFEAQQNKYEGDSILEISIDESGKVVKANLKNDLPYGLNEKSLQIIQQMIFSPAQVAGENVKSKIIFRIKYRNEN